jgi:transposase
MALCYSRYLYLEFTLSQSMGSFLRCLQRGIAFYGGTTVVDIFDNMKTVVQDPKNQIFNPRFLQFAAARGFAAVACNPGKGNEKGRVERPIGFIRERFWPGRRFGDLLDLNVQATAWRDDFANNRVHEVTGKVPSLVFEHRREGAVEADLVLALRHGRGALGERYEELPCDLRPEPLLRPVAARRPVRHRPWL